MVHEQVLQTFSQQVHQHDVVLALRCHCMNLSHKKNYFWDACDRSGGIEVLVGFGFEIELGEFSGGLFEFSGEFFVFVGAIFCEVDFTKGAGA
jgi:hypothetical protein